MRPERLVNRGSRSMAQLCMTRGCADDRSDVELVAAVVDRDRGALQEFIFGHNERADHSARLADVELMRPVTVVCEFILGQAPRLHFFLDLFGDSGIRAVKPQPTLLIGVVLFQNFASKD